MREYVVGTARLIYADVYAHLGSLEGSPFAAVVLADHPASVDQAAHYAALAGELLRVLLPGGHIIARSDTRLYGRTAYALEMAGFEQRAVLARLFGDEHGQERDDLVNCWEPWVLQRRPMVMRTVAENLRRFKTGALRRLSTQSPLADVIRCGSAPFAERALAGDLTAPQSFLRLIARALTPLHAGPVLEPLATSPAFAAACAAENIPLLTIFGDEDAFEQSVAALPELAQLSRAADPSIHGATS